MGICSLLLGGGRETKESVIDLSVGISLHKKKGDFVKKGESIATLYANDRDKLRQAIKRFEGTYGYCETPVEIPSVIKGIVE